MDGLTTYFEDLNLNGKENTIEKFILEVEALLNANNITLNKDDEVDRLNNLSEILDVESRVSKKYNQSKKNLQLTLTSKSNIKKEDYFSVKFSEAYFYTTVKKISTSFNSEQFLARGLFIKETRDTNQQGNEDEVESKVVIRGYDKFFNLNEVSITKPKHLSTLNGKFEVTNKQNGCIFFISYDPKQDLFLLASKHSMLSYKPTAESFIEELAGFDPEFPCKWDIIPEKPKHNEAGRRWLLSHLKTWRKMVELQLFLKHFDITLVTELCDDTFEEHILAYPTNKFGLHLHGINYNSIKLLTWPSAIVQKVARYFNFHTNDFLTFNSYQEVIEYSEKVDKSCLEGLVARNFNSNQVFMFKIKFLQPYLLFREFREITKKAISNQSRNKYQKPKVQFQLSNQYFSWVTTKVKIQPELFTNYNSNLNIIYVRDLFFKEAGCKLQLDNIIEDTTVDNPEEGNGTKADQFKVVVLPVATVGCGKTRLCTTLQQILPSCCHLQNDDFNSNKNNFLKAIVDSLHHFNIILADRNYHQAQARKELIDFVTKNREDVKFVALHFCEGDGNALEGLNLSYNVLELLYKRLLSRGTNHQTLSNKSTANLERITARFLEQFEPIVIDNLTNKNEEGIELIIPMNIFKDTQQIVGDVVQALDKQFELGIEVSNIDVDQLVADTDLKCRNVTQAKPSKEINLEKVAYVAIFLISDIMLLMKPKLTNLINNDKEAQTTLNKLFRARFVPGNFHVTLAHSQSDEDTNLEIFKSYLQQTNPLLGLGVSVWVDKLVLLEQHVVLKVSRVTDFNGECIDLPTSQKYLHITLQTGKNKEAKFSNEILEKLPNNGSENALEDVKGFQFDEEIQLLGRVFYR